LHCHLGSIRSSRRQFAREKLAGRLSSEGANEGSQRFVAMIA